MAAEIVEDFVRTSIRHEQCFSELLNYDRKGQFIGKHPLIGAETEAERIAKLLKTSPEDFLKEYSNVKQNVSRYSSFLKSSSRPQDQKQRDRKSLEKWSAVCDIYSETLKNTLLK